MTRTCKRWLRTEWAAAFFAMMLTGPLIYWSVFDRTDPVRIVAYGVTPSAVMAGDTIYRELTVFRTKSCPTDPDVTLIDGARTVWRFDEPEVLSPGPIGVIDNYRQRIVIPLQATPGKAELRVSLSKRCNPLQKWWPLVTHLAPVYFEILPAQR